MKFWRAEASFSLAFYSHFSRIRVLALWLLLIKLFKISNRLFNFSRAIHKVRSNLVKKKKKRQAGCYINHIRQKSKGNMWIHHRVTVQETVDCTVCQAAWRSWHLLHIPLFSYLMQLVFLGHYKDTDNVCVTSGSCFWRKSLRTSTPN